jgi:hypothetical protein|tara:strand:- start:360 stop:461 length:102 start_codon:yes stop_codon:yes gene_type:complete
VDETDTMDVARKLAVVQESVVDVETLVSTSTVS